MVYSDVSVGNLWPTTTSLLNNQFSLSFSCETNSCPMKMNCLLTVILTKFFCSLIFVKIGMFYFFSWKAPLLFLRTQGWISVFYKSSRWFWCRLGPPSRHLPSPFSVRRFEQYSQPLCQSKSTFSLDSSIMYCNWGYT